MLIDSHCHLADEAFAGDIEAVIERAREAGLIHALCILAAGNSVEAERAAGLRARWEGIRTAVGVHPHQAGEFEGKADASTASVREHVGRDPDVRAIGEIGLDYHYDFAPRETQRDVFRAQLRLAGALDLPVIIHTREAEEDTLRILREESAGRPLRGVLHCFTGSQALAEAALALGMHVSFAGIVTFPKAVELRKIVPLIPDDRVLCETDSPDLAPTPYRGKRNEPAWVGRVADDLAAVRGVPTAVLRKQMETNFATLFRP